MKFTIFLILFVLIISCADKKKKYLHENEAFVGAPPLINHEIEGYEDCLDCHSEGADEDATETPHAERTNCIQCHVPANTEIKPDYRNTFISGYHQLSEEEREKIKEKLKNKKQ